MKVATHLIVLFLAAASSARALALVQPQGEILWTASGTPAQELIERMRRLISARPPLEAPVDLSGLKSDAAELREKLDEAEKPGIGIFFDDDHPTMVGQLLIGGPAESAGIGIGDVFLEVNGHPVVDMTEIGRWANEGPGPIDVLLKTKGHVILRKKPPVYLSADYFKTFEAEYRSLVQQIDALAREAAQPMERPFIAELARDIAAASKQLGEKLVQAQIRAGTEYYRSS